MEISDKTDYHLHTYYSDGVFSPAQVVSWAHKNGLEHIAITDHDGVEGIEEAKAAAKKFDIDVTPGIEFSTATTDGVGSICWDTGSTRRTKNCLRLVKTYVKKGRRGTTG